MSTAIEDAMRFHPAPGTGFRGKPNERTKELSNGVGYCVRRVRVPLRRGAMRAGEVWDVFAPGPVLIGVEPTMYWAMRLADVDYCTRGRMRKGGRR